MPQLRSRDAVDEVWEAILADARAKAGFEGTWSPERTAALMARPIRHEEGVE